MYVPNDIKYKSLILILLVLSPDIAQQHYTVPTCVFVSVCLSVWLCVKVYLMCLLNEGKDQMFLPLQEPEPLLAVIHFLKGSEPQIIKNQTLAAVFPDILHRVINIVYTLAFLGEKSGVTVCILACYTWQSLKIN